MSRATTTLGQPSTGRRGAVRTSGSVPAGSSAERAERPGQAKGGHSVSVRTPTVAEPRRIARRVQAAERVKSGAAQRAYARRKLRAEGAGAFDAVLPRGSVMATRIPFVAAILALLGCGLALTLLLTTRAAEDSYLLSDARKLNQTLADERAALQREVEAADSAPELAARARELGMIPAKDPARLVVGPDGSIIVIGDPKPAEGAPVPPLNPPPTRAADRPGAPQSHGERVVPVTSTPRAPAARPDGAQINAAPPVGAGLTPAAPSPAAPSPAPAGAPAPEGAAPGQAGASAPAPAGAPAPAPIPAGAPPAPADPAAGPAPAPVDPAAGPAPVPAAAPVPPADAAPAPADGAPAAAPDPATVPAPAGAPAAAPTPAPAAAPIAQSPAAATASAPAAPAPAQMPDQSAASAPAAGPVAGPAADQRQDTAEVPVPAPNVPAPPSNPGPVEGQGMAAESAPAAPALIENAPGQPGVAPAVRPTAGEAAR